MDVSYVAPTAAGIPLNLDAVGIAIQNFDTSVLVNITNYDTAHEMFINGKLKPRLVKCRYLPILQIVILI